MLKSLNIHCKKIEQPAAVDQQASRAFAAELLAPRQALVARTEGWADKSMVETFAQEFEVSTMLIENQLENANISLEDN